MMSEPCAISPVFSCVSASCYPENEPCVIRRIDRDVKTRDDKSSHRTRAAVYYDVLQCAAARCSMLQCVAVRCRVLRCVFTSSENA